MKNLNQLFFIVICASIGLISCQKEDDKSTLVNFETLNLSTDSYWNGSDESGGFSLSGVTIPNSYNTDWASWTGFAYSNLHDVKTSGWSNQYSSYVPADTNSTNTFVVAYISDGYNTINFDTTVSSVSLKVTNNTYAALSMKNGDDYAKKFGGDDNTDEDWFKLQIIGLDENEKGTDTTEVYLADYRFANSSEDYILNKWKTVNLSNLGKIRKLKFVLSSSDNGDWGMNTPGYFCLDDLKFESVSSAE